MCILSIINKHLLVTPTNHYIFNDLFILKFTTLVVVLWKIYKFGQFSPCNIPYTTKDYFTFKQWTSPGYYWWFIHCDTFWYCWLLLKITPKGHVFEHIDYLNLLFSKSFINLVNIISCNAILHKICIITQILWMH